MNSLKPASTPVKGDYLCAAGLFIVQSFGPAKLGFAFSPVMLTYFAFNSGVGIYNIFKYTNGAIFKVRG